MSILDDGSWLVEEVEADVEVKGKRRKAKGEKEEVKDDSSQILNVRIVIDRVTKNEEDENHQPPG